jgi:hypothetical protein
MKETRKKLKNFAVIALALAVLSLINVLFELFFGELNSALNNAIVPDGAPGNIVLIAKVFVLVVSLFIILPQIYIGVKGIRIAKDPDSSISHIVWGIILVIFTASSLISPFLSIIRGDGNVLENASQLLSVGVDVFVLVEYVKYAIAVRSEI